MVTSNGVNKVAAVVKDNQATCWMLAFIAAFYGSLWLSGPSGHSTDKAAYERARGSFHLSGQEMSQRETRFRQRLLESPRFFKAAGLLFLAVMAAGLAVNVYCLRRVSRGMPVIPAAGEIWKAPPWGFREVVLVFTFLFFSEAWILILEIIFASLFELKKVDKNLFLMADSLIRDCLAAALVLWLVARKFREPFSQIGLCFRRFLKNVSLGLVGYVAMIPALVAILYLVSLAAQFFSYEPVPQAVVEIYLKESKEKSIIFFTFFVAILGPIIEEIFFRGFTYQAFRKRYGAVGAMLGTAALFAAMHMNLTAFVPIFALGVFLAYLYERTGSLVPSMTAHMVHNLIMVFLTLSFKSLSSS